MILTVDIGNTNIKVGAWDKDQLVFVSRLQTIPRKTKDEYAINLLELFRLNESNPAQFDGAIISSVVPPLSLPLKTAIQEIIQSKRVFLISPGLKTGLNIKIDNPATLGGDLVCAAVGVIAKYPLPCIFISMGTATALFAINEEGDFLGGTISPGLISSLEALSNSTAQLPYISLESPTHVIGTNTVDSMKAGTVYGTASMLDGMIDRINAELSQEAATVVACGGIAQSVVPYCKRDIIVDDDLVMEGLKLIYHKNTRR